MSDNLREQLRAIGEPPSSIEFVIAHDLVRVVDDDLVDDVTSVSPSTTTGD